MKLLQRKAPSVTRFSLPLAPSALFRNVAVDLWRKHTRRPLWQVSGAIARLPGGGRTLLRLKLVNPHLISESLSIHLGHEAEVKPFGCPARDSLAD